MEGSRVLAVSVCHVKRKRGKIKQNTSRWWNYTESLHHGNTGINTGRQLLFSL